jgi:hypothetical protein
LKALQVHLDLTANCLANLGQAVTSSRSARPRGGQSDELFLQAILAEIYKFRKMAALELFAAMPPWTQKADFAN